MPLDVQMPRMVALIHLLAAWAMVSGELVSLISGVLLLFL